MGESKKRDWSAYNAGLCKRGSLTLWINKEVEEVWKSEERTGEKGCPKTYSDLAIETSLLLRKAYRLTYRQTQGFLSSLVELLDLKIKVPNYTTFCKRHKNLRVKMALLHK